MYAMIEKDTGDGCEDRGQYTVNAVVGVFATMAAAESWANGRASYGREYEAFAILPTGENDWVQNFVAALSLIDKEALAREIRDFNIRKKTC